jgi:hypothetical protein
MTARASARVCLVSEDRNAIVFEVKDCWAGANFSKPRIVVRQRTFDLSNKLERAGTWWTKACKKLPPIQAVCPRVHPYSKEIMGSALRVTGPCCH